MELLETVELKRRPLHRLMIDCRARFTSQRPEFVEIRSTSGRVGPPRTCPAAGATKRRPAAELVSVVTSRRPAYTTLVGASASRAKTAINRAANS